MSRLKTKRPDEILTEYFFSLKDWPEYPDPFYKENNIKFGRFLRPANDLLFLCDGDIEKAKIILAKVLKKAHNEGLDDAGIEYVIEKWPELSLNI